VHVFILVKFEPSICAWMCAHAWCMFGTSHTYT